MIPPLSQLLVYLAFSSGDLKGRAVELAKRLSLSLYRGDEEFDYLLEYSDAGLALVPSVAKGFGSIRCDFSTGEHSHRRHYGGGNGQAIAKAVGISGKFTPSVLDLTAGLGADGFVLATLGCNVTLLERNPIVHSLLADGIERGTAAGLYDSELGLIMARLSLLQASSSDYLQVLVDRLTNCADDSESASVQPDVVYIDPMFPLRKKSAKVKKEMQAFHQIVGTDNDSDALLNNALTVAQYRVVVKRPAGAGFLAEAKPSYSLKGKSTRYDIYTLKKLPG
jgi:16S rRNA (guanine1516-N2)-methyltransferase